MFTSLFVELSLPFITASIYDVQQKIKSLDSLVSKESTQHPLVHVFLGTLPLSLDVVNGTPLEGRNNGLPVDGDCDGHVDGGGHEGVGRRVEERHQDRVRALEIDLKKDMRLVF